jgi:hypothetical protein
MMQKETLDGMVLLDIPLEYILSLLATTAVLSFLLDNFCRSFLRGFTLIDSEKLRLVNKLLSIACIVLGIYIVYLYY